MVTTRTGRDVRYLGFVNELIKTSVQIMVKLCVWDDKKMTNAVLRKSADAFRMYFLF